MHPRTAIIGLGVAALLAGCVADDPARAVLQHDGRGGGEHEDRVTCDDEARLILTSQGDAGRVNVTVRDGNGTVLFADDLEGVVDAESEVLLGAPGEWVLRALRSDDFDGAYSLTLRC